MSVEHVATIVGSPHIGEGRVVEAHVLAIPPIELGAELPDLLVAAAGVRANIDGKVGISEVSRLEEDPANPIHVPAAQHLTLSFRTVERGDKGADRAARDLTSRLKRYADAVRRSNLDTLRDMIEETTVGQEGEGGRLLENRAY